MIRIDRPRVVRPVAIDTVCREPRVLVVFVTVFAGGRAVRACQHKLGCVVVKGRRDPRTRRVTRLTLITETRQKVYRTRRPTVVRLMTLVAIGKGQLIVAVHMT